MEDNKITRNNDSEGGIISNNESNAIMPEIDFCDVIAKSFGFGKEDIRTISPLTLAYIGDCVYDLVIRTIVVKKCNTSVNSLHKQTTAVVKAQSQKESFKKIESLLTQEEMDVFKRGRNAKSYTSAKNASKSDYHYATGFEALMGYLYMTGQTSRMMSLIKAGLEN